MQDLQSIFNRVEQAKKKRKDIKKMYKAALDQTSEYQDINEEMKTLREKKKRVETAVKEQFSQEMIQLSDLKIDIESDMEILSDIALSQMVKGQAVGVTDSDNNEYEPIFSVKFKKTN